jgi:hypothetical protein
MVTLARGEGAQQRQTRRVSGGLASMRLVLKTDFGSLLDRVYRIVRRTIFKAIDASIDQGIGRWNSNA